MSALTLARALRNEAEKVSNVRHELRYSETPREEAQAQALNNAAELIRVLARLVDGKSMHGAFGAPGDFGYETPIGAALSAYYQSATP